MEKAIQAVLAGNEGQAEGYLNVAGQLAVANVHKSLPKACRRR
jgi:hypothetical protein